METPQHWDRLAKNQPAEITMFQISEVQESPAFTDRRSFLALRGIVVRQEDERTGRRRKFASAHDIRRGFAQRLINLGVSAETLKVVLRQRDFATTEKFYGAIRSAQSAAREVRGKLAPASDSPALVRGLVGGHEKAPRLSTEELRKRKAVIHSFELNTPHWCRAAAQTIGIMTIPNYWCATQVIS